MYVPPCARIYLLKPLRYAASYFSIQRKKFAYDSVRTSHRRANKNRKTPKCLTLKSTTPQHPPYFRRHHASGQVILDCDLVENPRKMPSPERALDSRAKAPPTKRSEKGYGDENGEQFGSFQKFASSSLSV